MNTKEEIKYILSEITLINDTIKELPNTETGRKYHERLAQRSNELSKKARDLYKDQDPDGYKKWAYEYFLKTGIKFNG
jgi:hypothetical protein